MGLVPEGKALYSNELNSGNMIDSGWTRWPEHAAERIPIFASKTSGVGFVKYSRWVYYTQERSYGNQNI
jgi:hypothetical protein